MELIVKLNKGDSRHVDPIGGTMKRRLPTREMPEMKRFEREGCREGSNEREVIRVLK